MRLKPALPRITIYQVGDDELPRTTSILPFQDRSISWCDVQLCFRWRRHAVTTRVTSDAVARQITHSPACPECRGGYVDIFWISSALFMSDTTPQHLITSLVVRERKYARVMLSQDTRPRAAEATASFNPSNYSQGKTTSRWRCRLADARLREILVTGRLVPYWNRA